MSLSLSTLTDITELVIAYIAENEGCRLRVYKDTKGLRTIGYGCNLEEPAAKALFQKIGVSYTMALLGNVALTEDQAKQLLVFQIFPCVEEADRLIPAFQLQPAKVKTAIVDLIFNMGGPRFEQFNTFISLIKANKYKEAAADLAGTLWTKQVGTRAKKAIALLESA